MAPLEMQQAAMLMWDRSSCVRVRLQMVEASNNLEAAERADDKS